MLVISSMANRTPSRPMPLHLVPTVRHLIALVRQQHEGLSWSRARRLCENGQVLVDGAPRTDPAFRLSEGQEVRIEPSRPREREPAAALPPLFGVHRIDKETSGLTIFART